MRRDPLPNYGQIVSSTQMIVGVQRFVTVNDRLTGPATEVGVVVMAPAPQLGDEVTKGMVVPQQTVTPVGRVTEPLLPMALQ
ncbi:MAG: hypothetical protein AB1510_05590 [Bacillota bacterium]